VNGATQVIAALASNGVDVAFCNPGTSEMHFVAALDSEPELRGILGLFEGVVTGAADGYGRVTGKPAATLLHLGPGLANGLANLHNARRARTPVVNLVGDHATYHKCYDPPLESDIESLATPMSGWVHRCEEADDLTTDVTAAVHAAIGPPGRVATLIVHADLSWLPVDAPANAVGAVGTAASGSSNGAGDSPYQRSRSTPYGTQRRGLYEQVSPDVVEGVAKALRTASRSALLLGGTATRREPLEAASRVARSTGSKLLCETFPAMLERGAGVPAVERLGYLAEFVSGQLEGVEVLVLVDAASPVSFFAYPGKQSDLVPEGCAVHVLSTAREDTAVALEALAELVCATGESGGAPGTSGNDPGSVQREAHRPEPPTGALSSRAVAQAVGATLPEDAVVSDESNTAGLWMAAATAGCPPHRWMCLTGGAIGQGLPVATGAAVGAPGRRVVCLQADGSAMYTLQSWWTQARESLNVTTVVLDNHSYAILELELSRVGAQEPGPRAKAMLELDRPPLDLVSLAEGMGVPACRPTSAQELTESLERSFSEPGPSVVVADVGRGIG
jgi:acetolactate synthase I/II/III large subunit